MPLIDYVDPADIDGTAREALDSGRYEKRSPYAEIRLNNPPALRAMREYEDALFECGPVDEELFEFIMVAVAQANECEYCAGSHRENLIDLLDMDDERVAALADDDFSVLDDDTRAVVEFARQAALDPHRVGPDHIEALRDAGFDEGGIIQLLAIVGTCITANTAVSSLNVLPQDREEEFSGA